MTAPSQLEDTPTTALLAVELGRFSMPNPIMVASGTFGYAREMESLVELHRLGAILPKTVTAQPRPGNPPPRTVETAAGMLNSIGLDNDGIDAFIEYHLPYLARINCPIVVSIAGKTETEFAEMAAKLNRRPGVDAIELNMSCPNVSGGVDFATDTAACERVVAGCRRACSTPLFAKLTPNVTSITEMAAAAEHGGADAVTLINTLIGFFSEWKAIRSMEALRRLAEDRSRVRRDGRDLRHPRRAAHRPRSRSRRP